MRTIFALLLIAVFPFAQPAFSAAGQASITILKPWAAHTGRRTMSAAAYFTIKNTGPTADTLIGVKSDRAEMVTLHRSYEEDGIMRMDHIRALEIPIKGKAELSPGGYHIMLMSLDAPLKRGKTFPLTLVFEKAGEIEVKVDITGIGGPEN